MIEKILESIEKMKQSLGVTDKFRKYLEILKNEFTNDKEKIEFILELVNAEIESVNISIESDKEEEEQQEIFVEKSAIEPQLINSMEFPKESDDIEEPTIQSIEFNFEENYKLPCPPVKLIDKEKNKRLMELNIEPNLLFYLRTLTHPYKTKFSKQDQQYLNYLIDVEGYDQDLIEYLLSGLNDKLVINETFEISDPVLEYVEDYLALIGELLDGEDIKERVNVKISEESFEVNIRRKKTMFTNQVTLKWFNNYMGLWGFLHIPIKQPKKNK